MDKKMLAEDLRVFGRQVTSFPLGIQEAFDELMKQFPPDDRRVYYGIGECTPGGIIYKAAAEEVLVGEAENSGYEMYIIEKGEYLAITVTDWKQKTHTIKRVFDQLYNEDIADLSKASIEIYKDDIEMICMVRIDPFKQLKEAFQTATNELLELLSDMNEEDFNKRSTYGNWTVAQVAAHLHLSDRGMLRILKGNKLSTSRKPDEFVAQIKSDFLDFNTKNESPEFVRPEDKFYERNELKLALGQSRAALIEMLNTLDLTLLYEDFPFPSPGGMTGLELFAFIVYHTQRHIRQIELIRKHYTATASIG